MGIKKGKEMNCDKDPILTLYLAVIILAINDIRDYFRSIEYAGTTLPCPADVDNLNARSAISFITSKDNEPGSYHWMCDYLSVDYNWPVDSALDWKSMDFKRITENIRI